MPGVHGLHHVTAISGDAQKDYDFYTKILGLRLVKKTINFDDPETYHLYFGDYSGHPGSILTFFPWGTNSRHGLPGTGQLTVYSFSVAPESFSFWIDRFVKYGIEFNRPEKRFDESFITFRDHNGFKMELVATATDSRMGKATNEIQQEFAIRGFHGILLNERKPEETHILLTALLGHELIAESGPRLRFASGAKKPGTFVDILADPNGAAGRMGVGAVHHVAFRVENDTSQLELREQLMIAGYPVSPVMDRNYFHSIYFHEPGGVLFEAATDPPGFAIDEDLEKLGQKLMLPPWLEENRTHIESVLPPIVA